MPSLDLSPPYRPTPTGLQGCGPGVGLVPGDQPSYCFVTSLRATVFSPPLANLTVTLPNLSSTLTTVASLDSPLAFTFTLSPALNCAVLCVLAGTGVACSLGFGLAGAE